MTQHLFSKKKLSKAEIIKKDVSLKSWIQISEEKQEFYSSTLGSRTWEEYRYNERKFLKLKLGFAMFGPPSYIDADGELCFKEPIQNEMINSIVDIIEKNSNSEDIYLAFIYVIGNVNGEYVEFPIIRILRESDGYTRHTSFFIDILGRIYNNWNEFLEENNFPKCIYCYPNNGFYSCDKDGNIQLEYGYSPASKKLKILTRGLDNLSGVAMIGSAAIGLTSVAVPIISPILIGSAVAGVTSGIWTTARCTTTLMDMKKHGQPINLSNQDARAHWLSLLSGILGAAGAGAIHYTQLIARSGQVLGKIPGIVANSINIGCGISYGSLYIINQIMSLVENKQLTSLDSAELALSILFFFHTKIDVKSISKFLLKLQHDVIIDLNRQMNSNKKTILEFFLNEGRKQAVNRRGEIVKSLKVIRSSDNIMEIFRTENNFRENSYSSLSSYDDGDGVIVNHKLTN